METPNINIENAIMCINNLTSDEKWELIDDNRLYDFTESIREVHIEEAYENMMSSGDYICRDRHDEIVDELNSISEKSVVENYNMKLEINTLKKEIELLNASINSYKSKIEKDDEIMMCETLIKDTERIIKEDIDKTNKYNNLIKELSKENVFMVSNKISKLKPMELNY